MDDMETATTVLSTDRAAAEAFRDQARSWRGKRILHEGRNERVTESERERDGERQQREPERHKESKRKRRTERIHKMPEKRMLLV